MKKSLYRVGYMIPGEKHIDGWLDVKDRWIGGHENKHHKDVWVGSESEADSNIPIMQKAFPRWYIMKVWG